MLCKRVRNAAVAAQETVAAGVAPKYVPLVSNGVQLTPAGDMRFRRGEPLFAYFEVHQPLYAGESATTIQTRLKIINVTTGEINVDTGPRNATSSTRPIDQLIPVAEEIAVDKLGRAAYRMEVYVTESAGKSNVSRSANFSIE
jgi:hypothetical protein